jgi:hypothetical protein
MAHYPTIPLIFHTAHATTKAFIISWDGLCYSLLTEPRVLWYEPSCYNSFHFAITFKFVDSKI